MRTLHLYSCIFLGLLIPLGCSAPTDGDTDFEEDYANSDEILALDKADDITNQPMISLAEENVRTPDFTCTGSTLFRSNFKGEVVPLRSGSVSMENSSSPRRSAAPTQVRVVLDKIESLQPGFLRESTITRLGPIERVTLIEGDTLSIYVWNGNYTGLSTPIITGVSLSGLLLEDLLQNITLKPAAGGGAVRTVLGAKPIKKNSYYFGQRLAKEQMGGFVLSGTVRKPVAGNSWNVDLQEVAALSNQTLTSEISFDIEAAMKIYQSRQSKATVHQQGQFYGAYLGQAALSVGQTVIVAAPGSWAYHGDCWQGQTEPNAKQAAYWVPLKVQLSEGEKAPRSFVVATSTGQWTDPNALTIVAVYPDKTTVAVKPGVSTPFKSGMQLITTFLGTSATAIGILAK